LESLKQSYASNVGSTLTTIYEIFVDNASLAAVDAGSSPVLEFTIYLKDAGNFYAIYQTDYNVDSGVYSGWTWNSSATSSDNELDPATLSLLTLFYRIKTSEAKKNNITVEQFVQKMQSIRDTRTSNTFRWI